MDSFYQSLNKKKYVEFINAKLNIRKKTNFDNVNHVLAQASKYGEVRINNTGVHPKRQVYIFLSVSQEGAKQIAIFDAETGDKINRFRNNKSNSEKMSCFYFVNFR